MSGSHILALADDLTGALEVGAKFASQGIGAVVTSDPAPDPPQGVPILVIDTETRHLSPAEAAGVVRDLAIRARDRGVRLVYKKTDSTLRGNIGSELGALVTAYHAPLLYAPAYPRLGRTVRGGQLYICGRLVSQTEFARDVLNPIYESSIVRLIARESPVPVIRAEAGLLSVPAIYVVDGETDEDVRAAAAAVGALAAGPAALAEYIAERIDLPRGQPPAWPVIRNCLVVNGSRHEMSARQVSEAGWRGNGWQILETDVAGGGLARAVEVGRMVRAVLERQPLDALVVFGGDTTAGIVKALGSPAIHPVGEIVPGVPVSRLGRLHLITKAGGFGSVQVLSEIRQRLPG